MGACPGESHLLILGGAQSQDAILAHKHFHFNLTQFTKETKLILLVYLNVIN